MYRIAWIASNSYTGKQRNSDFRKYILFYYLSIFSWQNQLNLITSLLQAIFQWSVTLYLAASFCQRKKYHIFSRCDRNTRGRFGVDCPMVSPNSARTRPIFFQTTGTEINQYFSKSCISKTGCFEWQVTDGFVPLKSVIKTRNVDQYDLTLTSKVWHENQI